MTTYRAFCVAILLALISVPAGAAPFNSLSMDVGVCDPNAPQNCIKPDSSGNVPITGTISASLGGFTPSAAGARGTPLTVTTSDSSGTLPTGAVVIVSNVGTTNPMYCNVNGVAATTADQLIGANSWFAFTIPVAVTTLRCIATGGSTTANTLGGAGLATGAGGGSASGGGGGAVTIASGAVASGAYSSGSIASGALASGSMAAGSHAAGAGVDGWDLTQGAIADAAVTAGATGSVSAKLRSISRDVMTVNTWAGGTLAAMAAYGTPPTGLVPGVNAFVTNTLAPGQAAAASSSPVVLAKNSGTGSTVAGAAVGTAGTASAEVVTVQGIASMTPILTNPQSSTTGGATPYTPFVPAASDNHQTVKNGAGTSYSVTTSNNSATKNYLRLYDAGTGFNGCNSATGVIFAMEIPPTDSGFTVLTGGTNGLAFTTGLSVCVTSGFGLTDTTNATATAMYVNIAYK